MTDIENQPQSPPPAPPPQQAEEKKPRRKIGWVLIVFCCLTVFGLSIASIYGPLPIPADKTIVIAHGSTIQQIGDKLQAEGITPRAELFRIAARLIANNAIKAGEYKFTPKQNLIDAILMMHEGRSIVRMLTVPEGLTTAEVAAMIRSEPALAGDLPAALPPEGSLLPETYRYNYGDTKASMIERMQKSFRDQLNALWVSREQRLPLASPKEAVIMASLIEKETGKKPEERARVAGVFYNRLRLNMRLQSDPTVIFALTKGQKALGRSLTHDDLAIASPYNTYINIGLPPGPICNPGRASLEAALHPEENDFLYFVADGTGGHAFAKDLSSHNTNINHWLNRPKP